MRNSILLMILLLLTACSSGQEKPVSVPTQNPTAVAIAAEATVTAMARSKPTDTPIPSVTPPAQMTTAAPAAPQDFWVVYLSKHKLATVNGKDSKSTLLTNTPGMDYYPVWSPDGKQLAFLRFNGESHQDGILNILPAGSDTPQQLDPANTYSHMAWMRDSQVLLVTAGMQDNFYIFLLNASSGSREQIAKNVAGYPRISPDGKKILLLVNSGTPCNGKGCVSPNDLFLYDVATKKTTQLTGDAKPKSVRGWSPDGNQIAFSYSEVSGEKADIIQIDGKLVAANQELPWWIWNWIVSPDGSKIAYFANNASNGSTAVYIRPIDGGDPQMITHLDKNNEAVSYIDTLRWRPDGTGLIFNVFTKLNTVNLDGSDLRTIPVSLENVFFDVRPVVGDYNPPPSPTAPASWKLCPGGLDSRLDIGRQAQVTSDPPTPNNIREAPTKNSRLLGQIQPGEKVDILEGPVCDNGLIWWQIQSTTSGLKGYTLEGDLKNYWLVPVK
jgi:Tol biopolymer transport system component